MDKIRIFFANETNQYLSIASVSVVILGQLVKSIMVRKIQKNKNSREIDKVSYVRSAKSYTNFFTGLILSVIWFSQIESLFFSVFAIAAAMVIASKELIMTFLGGLLSRVNGYFRLGDRIEVDGVRGFVIEKGMTSTKVLEMGPERSSQQTTGNVISIPNSVFLTKSVKNVSFFKGFAIKSYNFKLPSNVGLDEFEEMIMGWGQEICGDYIKEAEDCIGNFCRKEGLVIPLVAPRCKLVMNDSGEPEVMLKIPVRNYQIGDIEQQVYRKYIQYLQSN